MKCIAKLMLLGSAAAILSKRDHKEESKVPITEKVMIEGTEVYGQSAGTDGSCKMFATQFVSDPAKPSVTVCGTSTKAKVYLRARCEAYHHYVEEVGQCDTSAPSDGCVTASPATQSWMSTAQSYEIVPC